MPGRIDYHDDPDAPEPNSIVPSVNLTGRPLAGRPTPSDESSEVRWVPATDIGTYEMDRAMRKRIDRHLSSANVPEIS